MIESLVEQIEARHAEVQAQMADPEIISDRQRYAEAGRLFNHLAPAAKLAEEWRLAVSDSEGAQELLAEGEDPDMRALTCSAWSSRSSTRSRHASRRRRRRCPIPR